jgi:hypothetical protein
MVSGGSKAPDSWGLYMKFSQKILGLNIYHYAFLFKRDIKENATIFSAYEYITS